jgi:DNA-binding response OmpR family regulator
MSKIKILMVEDDELSAELIGNYLRENDFSVTNVYTVTDGISYSKQVVYDLVLLDLNLPDFHGFEMLKSIKSNSATPIIILSAQSETKTKVLAFKYGASDYMIKPIDLEELEARIWVQLSKHSKISLDFDKDDSNYDFVERENTIYFKKTPLDLTAIEYEILSILVRNSNKTISREHLISTLSKISSNRSLDNHIKNIRKKIGDNGSKPRYLKTEYGIGYRLINSLG